MFTTLVRRVGRFLVEDDGPTAVEYVFMAAIIVIVCLMSINIIGQVTSSSLDNSSQAIVDALDE